MRGFLPFLGILITAASCLFWLFTRPDREPVDFSQTEAGDAEAGALVFAAAGCASCHKAPDASSNEKLILAGGRIFSSDFGIFFAPNISPDPQVGIGSWSLEDFAIALTQGVSPDGAHYYPAFPYTAYGKMKAQDVANLFAFIGTLPPSSTPSLAHNVAFPFSIRRGIGLWKRIFVREGFHVTGSLTPEEERGRYIAEALAHCAECHTARNAVGALNKTRWLAGAPNPSGEGKIPNITPANLDWSHSDLVEYFTSGFTPEYDSAGGEMVEVIENLVQLPEEDREALAAYIKSVPAIP